MRTKTTVIAVFAMCCRIAYADVTNIISSADTFISERDVNNSAGAHTHVAAGSDASTSARRGLYLFDISGNVPVGAIVNSVTLSLTVVGEPGGGGADSTFDLFRTLVAWGEGTQSGNRGASAQAGDATWNSAQHGSVTWSAPGGTAGTDFAATASASASISNLATYTWSSAAMALDVQAWLDTPANNFGWILISQAESTGQTAHQFSSRESGANEPTLSIDFSPVPEPTTLALLGLGVLALVRRKRV